MKLLNKKSILDCEEYEREIHFKDIENVIEQIALNKNYNCALVCKYQDKYHKREKQKIYGCKISEIWGEIERFDCKNGCDLCIDDDNYLVLMIYGQGYTFNDEYHLITMAIKILPYDENRNFLDVSSLALGFGSAVVISANQFELNKHYS